MRHTLKMNKNNNINNLTEFIQKISELNNSTNNFRSTSVSSLNFYRGQSNSSWELEPKLYRENLFKKEGVLISEFIRISPNHFNNGNYFDQLVKMQHYGLPTRLLDTTQNPLVALFFACYDENQKTADGNVYFFPQLPTFNQNNSFVSLILKYIFEYSEFPLDIENFKDQVSIDSKIHSAHTTKIQTIEDILHFLIKVPYLTIVPKLNNPRIINQDGAFFLFGMKVKSVNRGRYEFEKIKYDNEIEKFWKNSQILKIPANSKSLILRELSNIGISKNKMFPELEYQAEFITNKIKYDLEQKVRTHNNV